ncbi:MAG: hypothetical protein GY869_29630 [Planctomycetes bacterium]|nr:hypothetical protein [Planctomycetota bacterium]
MRKILGLILLILWVGGGCEVPDASYKARLVRLVEVSELMDKGVENYGSKELYDKEIEALDLRYESLERRWESYSEGPMKDKF